MQSKTIARRELLIIVPVGFIVLAVIFLFAAKRIVIPVVTVSDQLRTPMSYQGNIVQETQENKNFRRVLFTGPKSQLVVMNIVPGGEIGEETHAYTEQTLFFLSGIGEGILNDKKIALSSGDVVVVPAGTKHNFINTGTQDLKIYTVYTPPNHIDGRVHVTKADADADTADEAIGQLEPLK